MATESFKTEPSIAELNTVKELEENFRESIGIDKTIVTNILISKQSPIFEKKENTDNLEIIRTADGRVTKCIIADNQFGMLKITPDESKDVYMGELSLLMEPKSNLNNMNTKEYTNRLKSVLSYIKNNYDILYCSHLNRPENLKINYIEINVTLRLSKPYNDYIPVIEWFNNVYRDKNCNNGTSNKVSTYANIDHTLFKKEPESYYSHFRSYEFTIYDKTAEMKDKYDISLTQNYIRFEIKFKKSDSYIKTNFPTVDKIKDNVISNVFIKFLEENLFTPFNESIKITDDENNFLSNELLQKNNNVWVNNFKDFLLKKERNIHRHPILDVAYLEPYIRKILSYNPNVSKRLKLLYKKFDGTVYSNNKVLVDEIFEKLKIIFNKAKNNF